MITKLILTFGSGELKKRTNLLTETKLDKHAPKIKKIDLKDYDLYSMFI